MTDNLDLLIKEYSKKLMELLPDEEYQKEQADNKKTATEDEKPEERSRDDEQSGQEIYSSQINSDEPDSVIPIEVDTDAYEAAAESSPAAAPINTAPVNFAAFRASVFTGDSALAVENARISVRAGNELYAFLVTDKNGETITVKLEAFPRENSLEPLSDEQSMEYFADVYAEGFIPQENLLISAVGGSDIVLKVQLVPESEGIN